MVERGASGQEFEECRKKTGWKTSSELGENFVPRSRKPRGRLRRTIEQELDRARKARQRMRERRLQAKTGLSRTA
jgi:hypothetical protein